MDAGLEILNDSGNIIIDQNYLSMAFLGKGSTTLNTKFSRDFSDGDGPYYDNIWRIPSGGYVSVPGSMLIAFRPRYSNRPVGIFDAGFGNSDFVGSSFDSTPPIVDWWAFGRPTVGAENFGLQVFDAAGQPTFISTTRHMKVVTAKSNVVFQNETITGPTGDYALIVGKPLGGVVSGTETSLSAGAYAWMEGQPMWYPPTSTGFTAPTFNGVERKEHYLYPTGWRTGDIRGSMMLIDVAGL